MGLEIFGDKIAVINPFASGSFPEWAATTTGVIRDGFETVGRKLQDLVGPWNQHRTQVFAEAGLSALFLSAGAGLLTKSLSRMPRQLSSVGIALIAGGAMIFAACGDSRKRTSRETGGEGAGDPGLSNGSGEHGTNTDAGAARDAGIARDAGPTSRPDAGLPPRTNYDHSELLPEGWVTRCLDNHTLQVETEEGEALYQSECPPAMECVYDICAQIPGAQLPSGWTPIEDALGMTYPLLCYVPRELDFGDDANANSADGGFWNRFDPAEIKRERVRCAVVGEFNVGPSDSAPLYTWSVAQETDLPDHFYDVTDHSSFEGTPYNDLRRDVCEAEEGVFLSSHDPTAWAEAVFSPVPTYRSGARHSDFYLFSASLFWGNTVAPSDTINTQTGSDQLAHSQNEPRPAEECRPVFLGGLIDATVASDETMRVYLRPKGGEGLGVSKGQLWNCLCPLAVEGSQ